MSSFAFGSTTRLRFALNDKIVFSRLIIPEGKSKESRDINLALDNIKAQIIKHYLRISDREAFVTAEMVRNAYQGIGTEYETLLRAFDKENEAFAKRVGKDRSLSTYQKYLTVRKYLDCTKLICPIQGCPDIYTQKMIIVDYLLKGR